MKLTLCALSQLISEILNHLWYCGQVYRPKRSWLGILKGIQRLLAKRWLACNPVIAVKFGSHVLSMISTSLCQRIFALEIGSWERISTWEYQSLWADIVMHTFLLRCVFAELSFKLLGVMTGAPQSFQKSFKVFGISRGSICCWTSTANWSFPVITEFYFRLCLLLALSCPVLWCKQLLITFVVVVFSNI